MTQALIPTSEGAVVELLWVGRCANDIIRLNGEVAVKGTGKDFKNHVCFVIKINEDGLITRIDEYYNGAWDEGVQEGEYKVMRGSSLKL
jgi:ketosteroid isomerase-like protein